MMSYKDRTFCDFADCKHSKGCDRFLSEDHRHRAAQLRIDIARLTEKPACYKKKKETK